MGTSSNGHARLEEAMALLIQNQAAFVANQAANDRALTEFRQRHLEYERRRQEFERQITERVDRIETQMKEVVRIPTEHTRQLERLTEAVRDRIGFKN